MDNRNASTSEQFFHGSKVFRLAWSDGIYNTTPIHIDSTKTPSLILKQPITIECFLRLAWPSFLGGNPNAHRLSTGTAHRRSCSATVVLDGGSDYHTETKGLIWSGSGLPGFGFPVSPSAISLRHFYRKVSVFLCRGRSERSHWIITLFVIM